MSKKPMDIVTRKKLRENYMHYICWNSFASLWNFFESNTHDAGVTKSLHLGDHRLFVMEVPVRF